MWRRKKKPALNARSGKRSKSAVLPVMVPGFIFSGKIKVQHPSGQFHSYADSRHFRIASSFATLIADTKQQREIQLADQIAGIYVANFDRVVKFWPDGASFEDFIAAHCDWSEDRFMTWQRKMYEFTHPPFTMSLPFTRWFVQIPRRYSSIGRTFTSSGDLKKVYALAEQLSPYRVNSFGNVVPMITPELFLLATSRADGIVLGERLRESGLLIDALQRAATRPLANPEQLIF